MPTREDLITGLSPGDIFHAEYPNGASCVCLVLSVTNDAIRARRVTTQENMEFDRKTGNENDDSGGAVAIINSVARLPPEIRAVFLEMDRKYRTFMAMDEISRFNLPSEQTKLTGAEKNALRFIDAYYPSNPLPPPNQSGPAR